MEQAETVKILLVEDDEDDYLLTKEVFSEMRRSRFTLDWQKTFSSGLEAMVLTGTTCVWSTTGSERITVWSC